MKKSVLFLCTSNSARSQMAEAILKDKNSEVFDSYSAGSNPANSVHPLAVEAMRKVEIDLSEKKTTSLESIMDKHFDFIITLCDKMKEECPNFPGQPIVAHWGMPDPAAYEGSDDERLAYFVKTRNEIANRITLFINIPMDKLDRIALENRVKEIANI